MKESVLALMGLVPMAIILLEDPVLRASPLVCVRLEVEKIMRWIMNGTEHWTANASIIVGYSSQ